MLQLLSGRYPTGADQVAVTPGLASELNLSVGDTWPQGGKTVVGIVQNPQSLLDEFALVPPGQVAHPTEVTVLLNAPAASKNLPSYVTPAGSTTSNGINPSTIVLALATVGMLLIALVSIGGFTVLAQRRMRSLGMLESMGATDRNVRLVLESNGVIVGFVGAVLGFALGLVLWLLYRPHNEQSAHHVIGTFALPWNVIVPAMVLAVIATFFAAGYPARAITRVPVVSALAGRPAPPRQIHRSLVPGVIALVIGFVMFSLSGAAGNGGGVIWLVPGLIALIVGIILVSPFFLALLARAGSQVAHRRSPALARHGALPGPLRLGPLGHQPRHHDRGHHLRRRRGPLLQCLRLRRTEHDGEHDQRVQPAARRERTLLAGAERAPDADGAGTPEPLGAGGDRRTPSPPPSVRRTWSSSSIRPWDCRTRAQPAGSGTAPSTWPRRLSCGPTASTPRPSPPTSTSSARGRGWPARACS